MRIRLRHSGYCRVIGNQVRCKHGRLYKTATPCVQISVTHFSTAWLCTTKRNVLSPLRDRTYEEQTICHAWREIHTMTFPFLSIPNDLKSVFAVVPQVSCMKLGSSGVCPQRLQNLMKSPWMGKQLCNFLVNAVSVVVVWDLWHAFHTTVRLANKVLISEQAYFHNWNSGLAFTNATNPDYPTDSIKLYITDPLQWTKGFNL
jgi:hypothetical protein